MYRYNYGFSLCKRSDIGHRRWGFLRSCGSVTRQLQKWLAGLSESCCPGGIYCLKALVKKNAAWDFVDGWKDSSTLPCYGSQYACLCCAVLCCDEPCDVSSAPPPNSEVPPVSITGPVGIIFPYPRRVFLSPPSSERLGPGHGGLALGKLHQRWGWAAPLNPYEGGEEPLQSNRGC